MADASCSLTARGCSLKKPASSHSCPFRLRALLDSDDMRLADRIALSKTPFIVRNASGELTQLSGASSFSRDISECPTRYVLSDDLTRLCTALAYSKGARTLACSDWLHVPAEAIWIEWCEAPWRKELNLYGFQTDVASTNESGRRGALIHSAPTGRRGVIRTFWATGPTEWEVFAGSMEAYFDFDAPEGGSPDPPDDRADSTITVYDGVPKSADVLRHCFRFRFERSWSDYYAKGALSSAQRDALARHALGTIAIDIPVILAFCLLLATRPSLPRRPLMLERLNRARARSGKLPLLEQTEVFSPLLPEFLTSAESASGNDRRSPRLHHVRGHLVRRGSQLFWRVPHLRGRARGGALRARTVTWTVDQAEIARRTSPLTPDNLSASSVH
jgi:hypothetical protein